MLHYQFTQIIYMYQYCFVWLRFLSDHLVDYINIRLSYIQLLVLLSKHENAKVHITMQKMEVLVILKSMKRINVNTSRNFYWDSQFLLYLFSRWIIRKPHSKRRSVCQNVSTNLTSTICIAIPLLTPSSTEISKRIKKLTIPIEIDQ